MTFRSQTNKQTNKQQQKKYVDLKQFMVEGEGEKKSATYMAVKQVSEVVDGNNTSLGRLSWMSEHLGRKKKVGSPASCRQLGVEEVCLIKDV